jgi:photosystem II stability/assembly factor-like uncharacterized protein
MKHILILCVLVQASLFAQKKSSPKESPTLPFDEGTVSSLSFRMVGPALTSGRVADIAVHPTNKDLWYIAAASGGVWLTKNHGITFHPIFDDYGSYSIGCVELSPSNPNTVWVGTGENNNQRSISYGDGVYKSVDGGKSFKNMGLKQSEHIGSIVIHPTNEQVLWVAAYGPLWSKGGERGVYKSVDGGKTWKRTLFISDDTGVAEVVIDPSNPDILYASAHQRRRHEWTYIGGGPESTLYKSTDGGETWREIAAGLPKSDMGRVGLAVSPADPNWVYAIVEGRYDKGGVYLSTNKGESWNKQGGFSTSGNYYQEIFCDPLNKRKVFAMDTYMHHTEDAGVTFKTTGESHKHVDNHVIWIDPSNTDHWLVGCDGGVYETYSHAKEWRFFDNLPITQFYKVTTDNDYPFYNIYGGTQDNNSMGGPSGTTNVSGILNTDWFITNGGDGFESATDWSNPNITYAQAQYGWLVRYDKQSGEKVPIQPMPAKGQPGYRWNWDAPLLVSKHDASTLYFAANKVFKSSNKGDDWTEISSDLSRQLDRNKLPVMGQVWSIDAVMKNASTTVYGNVVALDESPLTKGVLFAGTDDGLIQVSQNEGKDWKKTDAIPGVPAQTRVNMLTASRFNDQVVYAAFNNQRNGDFKPYLFKSSDCGVTWTSISSNLPERGTVYCIKQDFKTPNLLFVGTEFGAYFTTDEGQHWTKLSGLPTIAVYDLEIQERECDLVAATFGRGFYVLDNYSPLRGLTTEVLNKKAHLFETENALLYVPADPLGLEGTGFQGHNMWAAKNPTYGAVFSLFMKDEYKTLKDVRQEKEKALEKEKKDVYYPSFDELRKESLDEAAKLIWIISDQSGKEIRRMSSSPTKGIVRMNWNLRSNSTNAINAESNGFLVPPGTYFVSISLIHNGSVEELVAKQSFIVKGLNNQTLMAKNSNELVVFRNEVATLSQQLSNASNWMSEAKEVLENIETSLKNYPNTELALLTETRALTLLYDNCATDMWGDRVKSSREFETVPSINDRLGMVEYQLYENTAGVSSTHKANKVIVEEQFTALSASLADMSKRIQVLQDKLALVPIPFTKSLSHFWK